MGISSWGGFFVVDFVLGFKSILGGSVDGGSGGRSLGSGGGFDSDVGNGAEGVQILSSTRIKSSLTLEQDTH